MTYIADVAPTIASLLLWPAPKTRYPNIGVDTPYSVLELAEVVADSLGVARSVQHLKPSKEAVDALSDYSKVKAVFGAGPQVSLRDGIRRITVWASSRAQGEPRRFEDVEVMKNLPPSWERLIG